VDPYLQGTNFQKRIRLLSGFAARVRTGYYGNGKQVKNCTVSSAITAVGQTIALACDSNPTKVVGSERLLPRLQIMLDGYRKVDPATRKKLPVQFRRSQTSCRNGVPTRKNATPAGNRGSDNDCVLLPTPGRQIQRQRITEQHQANCPIQVRRHHFLQKEQPRRAPMPSAGCTCTSHLICRRGHIKIGQSEEWMEKSLRVSQVKRRGLTLPGPRARTSPHPPSGKWGGYKNIPLGLL